MRTNDYINAVFGNHDFIATPEALAHLAFCDINMALKLHREMLVEARESYAENPTNHNAARIEWNRRKLLVSCQSARMLIDASRAERLGYTECTVNASPEDIERWLDAMHSEACEECGGPCAPRQCACLCDTCGMQIAIG